MIAGDAFCVCNTAYNAKTGFDACDARRHKPACQGPIPSARPGLPRQQTPWKQAHIVRACNIQSSREAHLVSEGTVSSPLPIPTRTRATAKLRGVTSEVCLHKSNNGPVGHRREAQGGVPAPAVYHNTPSANGGWVNPQRCMYPQGTETSCISHFSMLKEPYITLTLYMHDVPSSAKHIEVMAPHA
jgi:hypothetical protein